MSEKAGSWEDLLFNPPPWPYAKDDPAAPVAHPKIKNYGYDSQALGVLPVQAGHTKPARRNYTGSQVEAQQYYQQFQVFRDVMLDKQWAACQRATPVQNAQSGGHRQSPGAADNQQPSAQTDTIEYLQCANNWTRPRSSSTDSGDTAVSQDCTDGSAFTSTQIKARRMSDTALNSQPRLSPGVSQGTTFAVLRIPMLCGILLIVAAELLAYFLVRQLVALYEKAFIWRGHMGWLFERLCAASSYQEYLQYAKMIDSQMGVSLEDVRAHSRYYDAPLLLRITESLRKMRVQVEEEQQRDSVQGKSSEGARHAVVALCDLLRQGALKANAGGWENRQIWSRAYSGTTRVVEDYIAESVACIDCVRMSPHLSPSEKLHFFRQVARQQGRMALCLSGGAAMGWKHLGIARSLLDEARLPRVISGTSAGSLVAALLGTHTDGELRRIIRPELVKYMTACQGSGWQKLVRWLTKGYYFDAVEWAPRAQVFTRGSLTFLEAFERTGKLLNISCTPMGHRYAPRKLLNYITAPNVIIWSAVLASACLPGVMQPMVLLMKTREGQIKPYTDSGVLWRDGSFRNDIPSNDLRASLNVQFTVVSQVNPHVSLFFYDRDGSIGQPPARRYCSAWRGGFIPSAIEHMLKLDIRKWLRLLCDLNLMPMLLSQDWSFVWLQKFDGDVTILPKARLSEHFRLLTDPTHESLVQSMQAGKIATWPKLKMIRTRQAVEDAITDGWVDAYHACTRSSHLMQSIPPKVAMAVAHAAKSIDQSKQQKQQALSGTLGAMSEASDDEDSVVFRALHTMRPRRDFIGPKQSSQRPARRIRGRRHRGTAESVGNRANRPPLAQLAAEEDWSSCSSSIAEDVWTG